MRLSPLRLYTTSMLGIVTLLSLAIFAYNCLHASVYIGSRLSMAERFVAPVVIAALMVWLLRARLETRIMAANVVAAIIVSSYLGEFYIAWRLGQVERLAAARSRTLDDTRSKIDVVRHLRSTGDDAYPIIRGRNLLEPDARGVLQPMLRAGGRPILPLASPAHTTVVSCNETGRWQVYETDRHGFNNADAVWDAAPNLAMIGDSFTHGSCVEREQNMESRLQARFGAALNLGVGGAGPLLELAGLTEYAKPLRPKVVLWVFFEGNDLNEDLPFELRSPLLLTYLHDARFGQDLIHRDDAVSSVLKAYLDRNLKSAMERVDDPTEDFVRYLTLDRLRSAVGLGPIQIGFNGGELDQELGVFDRVIAAAASRVHGWGGALYLVYLPDSDRYFSKLGASTVRRAIYDGVRSTAQRRGVPMIDVADAFARQPRPVDLFAYPGSHYNAAGYAVAADAIGDALARAGVPRRRP